MVSAQRLGRPRSFPRRRQVGEWARRSGALIRQRIAFIVFLLLEVLLCPLTWLGAGLSMLSLKSSRKRHRFSLTAYKVLLHRCLYHELGVRSDPVAKRLLFSLPLAFNHLVHVLLLGPTVLALRLSRWKGWAFPVRKPSTYGTFLQHRTEFFDRVFTSHLGRCGQVVILGAGFDTRAYGLLRAFQGRIFEVDRFEMQRLKLLALDSARVSRAHVRYVSVDFQRDSILQRLEEHGYDRDAVTLFLWEGVVYYLKPESVKRTLDMIRRHAGPGSLVAFDYPSREYLEHPPMALELALYWLAKLGEAWMFGLPTTPPAQDKVREFLQAHDLELVAHEPFGPAPSAPRPFGGVVLARSPG